VIELSLQDEQSPRTICHTSVVIPALNEERNIGWVLERIPIHVDEILVVDGRSTDGTIAQALRTRPDVRIVAEHRPGKGAALRAGFAQATGRFVAMLDADGSMDPAEIRRFIEPLEDGIDLVKGSRYVDHGGSLDITWLRSLGNRALTTAVNMLYRTSFSDLCYGFMAFRRDVLPRLSLCSDGFEIETEIVVKAIRSGLSIAEVGSIERPRISGASNLCTFRDGARVLRELLVDRMPGRAPTPVVDNVSAAAVADRPTEQTGPSVRPLFEDGSAA
jgi:glycosyltransferase involved in cell wall biosynthesis